MTVILPPHYFFRGLELEAAALHPHHGPVCPPSWRRPRSGTVRLVGTTATKPTTPEDRSIRSWPDQCVGSDRLRSEPA